MSLSYKKCAKSEKILTTCRLSEKLITEKTVTDYSIFGESRGTSGLNLC